MDYNGTMNTMGTVLRRAHDEGVSVEVLVEGHWLHGSVGDVDAHGALLSDDGDEMIVRLESIAAVHLLEQAHQAEPAPPDVVPAPREAEAVQPALAG
jgi:hypothetical protein